MTGWDHWQAPPSPRRELPERPSDEELRAAFSAGKSWRQWRDEQDAVPGRTVPAPLPPDPAVLERAEQAECYKRFRAYGLKVYNLSQSRASKQAPGLPDAWLVLSTEEAVKRGVVEWAGWWETKRQVGGEYSTAQKEFASECSDADVAYCTGDRDDAGQLLVRLGLAERQEDGSLEPRRR